MKHFLEKLVQTFEPPAATGLPVEELKAFYLSESSAPGPPSDARIAIHNKLYTQLRDPTMSNKLNIDITASSFPTYASNTGRWSSAGAKDKSHYREIFPGHLYQLLYFLGGLLVVGAKFFNEAEKAAIKIYYKYYYPDMVSKNWLFYARDLTANYMRESRPNEDLVQRVAKAFLISPNNEPEEIEGKWKRYVKEYMVMVMDGAVDKSLCLKIYSELIDEASKK